ncbi:glycosyltransferase family 4 protein [Patescibacteria group bacterium]|nr:glycosyltransferase family 4 protein [Patescibacteria group bacterium]MBU4461505.1 glycosyltransferase family 4 protein [Patescibacteria group bacterium]
MDLSSSPKIKICCVVSVDITLKFMLFNQLKFLQEQGYNVSAVCSPGKWIKDIRQQGIKVKTIRFKRRSFSPRSDMTAFFQLLSYFRKERFDIVHTHTPKPEIYGQLAAKLAGVPIIIDTLHGFDLSTDVSWLQKKIFIFLQRFVTKYSDVIFSVSKAVIQRATEEKICKPNLLKYLGRDIDTERFNSQRFSEEFILNKKKQLGIDSKKRIIGIVARLVEEKGYLELFESFKNILDKFPNTLLLSIGPEEPEKKDAIKSAIVKKYNIQKNVMFLGERSDIDEIYPLMDIFVLPTHREGVGASILEASATGKPVIASNTGGCPEAVEDGKTGILIPVKNVKKLTEAILFLFNNPEKAKEMGVSGREKILKEFNEKLIFDILGTEYQRLIKEKLK